MLIVAALYRFTRFPDPAALRPGLLQACVDHGVKGSILLATEGINGTIAGTRGGIDAVLTAIRLLPGCAGIEWKESPAKAMPFGRMKVKLKREIVTMGEPDIDPVARVGTYVEPSDWNALVTDPDTVVIDTRNAYEVAIGTFRGAVEPETKAFGDFPDWWKANRDRLGGKRLALFCTGGIRCEKATNYLLGQGVEEVLHLKGGILKYLEDVPEAESLWQGQCFVFDDRVSVGHALVPGGLQVCGACRRPVTEADQQRPEHEAGVCCPACVNEYSETDRARFRERQRQMTLAALRGALHLGA